MNRDYDNKLLRNVIVKSCERANAKLTDEEKDCLKRYGLFRSREGKVLANGWYDIGHVRLRRSLDKVDFVDRAEKAVARDFAHMLNVNYCGNFDNKIGWWYYMKITEKHDAIKSACNNKKYYGDMLANIDDEYDAKIAKLIAERDEKKKTYNRAYGNACERVNKMRGEV